MTDQDPVAGEEAEHAARSRGLPLVAAGLAHDVKNVLNAMAIQLALLGEKLGGEAGQVAQRHLAALQGQVGKLDALVRRFADVVDPSSRAAVDLGLLVGQATALLGHELRRRQVTLALVAPEGVAWLATDPPRLARLVLGLTLRAAAATPDGGALEVRLLTEGDEVVVEWLDGGRDPGPGSGYEGDVARAAAGALGGTVEVAVDGGRGRARLRLPRGTSA